MLTSLKAQCLSPLPRRIAARMQTTLASAAYTEPSQPSTAMTSSTPGDLTPQQREVLSRAIRVDQAGEVAANTIYEGQLLVLGRDPKYGPLIRVRLSVFFFSRQ